MREAGPLVRLRKCVLDGLLRDSHGLRRDRGWFSAQRERLAIGESTQSDPVSRALRLAVTGTHARRHTSCCKTQRMLPMCVNLRCASTENRLATTIHSCDCFQKGMHGRTWGIKQRQKEFCLIYNNLFKI